MPARFVTGPNATPFYRASQQTIDLLESASSLELSACVPHLKVTQVDPYTGVELEKPPLYFDYISMPGFAAPRRLGVFLERPLLSLESFTIRAESLIGLSYYRKCEFSFIIHDPSTVFYGEDSMSTFRAMMQEGNSFKVQYGWRGNVKNDLLNGVGFFDEESGVSVPAVRTLRVVVPTWNVSIDDSGEMRVKLVGEEDGELALREAKLSKYLDLANVETTRRNDKKRPRASLAQADRDASSARDVLSLLSRIQTITIKPYGEFYKLIDVLNMLVAPAVESAALTCGYKSIDLYLGNFSSVCMRSAKNMGAREYAEKSIGDFLVPVKFLKTELGKLHAAGEGVTLTSFINVCAKMISDQSFWQDERNGRLQPEIFVGTSTRNVEGGIGLILFFADRRLGTISDVQFDRGDTLDPDNSTKRQILDKLRTKGVPYLRIGHAGSIIKDANFDAQLDDQIRSVMVDNALKGRKSRVELTSQPDPLGRVGRSNVEDYTFFSGITAEITMVGNFIFNWGQPVWIDLFNVHPISGIYDIIAFEDTVTPDGFFTKMKCITRGTDPLNTRRRKSNSQLQQEQLDAEQAKVLKPKKVI